MKPDESDEPLEDALEEIIDNGDGSGVLNALKGLINRPDRGALNVLDGLIRRPDPLAGEEPPHEELKF